MLSANNDGITELVKGLLPGGHLVNNYEGECHLDNMRYPSQLSNVERSKEINKKAAR